MRTTSKCAAIAAISRVKSSAAKRPSPRRSGNEFDVATTCTPAAITARRKVTVISVWAMSSSSNSSMQSSRCEEKAAIADSMPRNPMMPASSANVRYDLRRRRLVPRGGEQVGLADAVAAVEVARGGAGGGPLSPTLRLGRFSDRRGEALHRGKRRCLRGMSGVGQVGRETCRGEASRRHEARQKIPAGQMGTAVDEPNDPAHLARAHSHSIVPGRLRRDVVGDPVDAGAPR